MNVLKKREKLKVVIPHHAAPDSFQDNVAHTLQKMGHEVTLPKFQIHREKNRIFRIIADAYAGFFPDRWNPYERWLVSICKQIKPDIILCLTQILQPEVIKAIKKESASTRFIAWWGDPPANMLKMGLLSDSWDQIYIKDFLAVKKFQAVGLNASLLHEAMNPTWHRPPGEQFGASISKEVIVAGNYYGYRQFIVEKLISEGAPIALYGAKPPKWSSENIRGLYKNEYIVKDQKSYIFYNGLACLNSTSLSEGNSLNCRAFEICGTGGLQLIENKPVVSECFEPMQEVLTYNSVSEILEHLERAQLEPNWARSIRIAGHRRANAHHTYEHRIHHILGNI